MKEPLERDIQRHIIQWASYSPIVKDFLIAIENERKTTQFAGKMRKKKGVRKGVSDLFMPYPCHGKYGLWIELKRNKKSKITKEQLEWLDRMFSVGYSAYVCYGYDETIKIIVDYLKGKLKCQITNV